MIFLGEEDRMFSPRFGNFRACDSAHVGMELLKDNDFSVSLTLDGFAKNL